VEESYMSEQDPDYKQKRRIMEQQLMNNSLVRSFGEGGGTPPSALFQSQLAYWRISDPFSMLF